VNLNIPHLRELASKDDTQAFWGAILPYLESNKEVALQDLDSDVKELILVAIKKDKLTHEST